MPRYIKYLSKRELNEKITHLGFTGHTVHRFVENAGDIVLFDNTWVRGNEQRFQSLLARENVTFLCEKGSFLLSFTGEDEIDALIDKGNNDDLTTYWRRIKRAITSVRGKNSHFFAREREVDLGDRPPLIMGIINVTPDSFSDGGRYFSRENAVARAQEMVSQGADIVDIGGESTRPGAHPVGEEEEMERVLPVVSEVAATTDVLISVDTYKSAVARESLRAGAHMVNDITGLRHSDDMADVVARAGAAIILMHMQGTPQDMQEDPRYESTADEINRFLEERAESAIRSGVGRESILVDPGIGFGKRFEDNIYILKNLEEFRSAGYPVVVGVSNKAFIGKATGKNVDDRVFGTVASISIAVYNGADVVRVHDVRAGRDAVAVAWEIKRGRIC